MKNTFVKNLTGVLMAAVICSLAGCGGNSADQPGPESSLQESQSEQPTQKDGQTKKEYDPPLAPGIKCQTDHKENRILPLFRNDKIEYKCNGQKKIQKR